MDFLKRNKTIRKGILMVIDALLIVVAYILMNFFTRTGEILSGEMMTYIMTVSVYLILFIIARVYRSIMEYTSAREYVIYLFVCMFAGVVTSGVLKLTPYEVYSVRENILASFFATGLIVGARVAFRFYRAFVLNSKLSKVALERMLIIGAGSAGVQVIRDLLPNMDKKYKVVGIIDDNKLKQNNYIAGINVIGGREKIISTCENEKVDTILFAIANIDKKEKAAILNICNETKAKIKVIPDMREILLNDRKVNINSFKDVQIEDLLGRDPIKLEDNEIKKFIHGKVVLVTGGGGSIGSELCRQIASFGAKELLMVDIYENTLYETELEIRKKYPELNLTAIIASVRDNKRIDELFNKYKPEVVFHAAAHKHVPLMETSPIEAIKNNVFGTYNVAKAADKHKVDKFILVSTDKAVNPTSVMGATKRICEMIIQMQNAKSKTNYVAVRFGNVLGSHGSVIPIFKNQIAMGGPVTVTHKDITRYFMTIPEAVGLILQAITFAEGGEIFVLDMGEPVKIYDLAYKLIKLSGYEPNVDIPIKVTGLRPGEKLYEELLVEAEGLSKTLHEKIMVTKIMDFDPKMVEKDLDTLKKLIDSSDAIDRVKVKSVIKKIVPTFIETEEHTKLVESVKNDKKTNKENVAKYVMTIDKSNKQKHMDKKANRKK